MPARPTGISIPRCVYLVPLVGLLFSLTGCPGGDREPAGDGPPPVPEAAAAPLEVALRPMEGSGITGQVRMVPRGGETHVTVAITDAGVDGVYPARIHTGECGDQGAERAALEPIRTDGTGQGRSEGVVELPAHQLMTGRDYIQVYVARGELHQAVACGELPARPDMHPGIQEQP